MLSALAIACGREGAVRSGSGVEMVVPRDGAAYVVASGAPTDLRVTVQRDDSTAIAGRTARNGDRLEFRPTFPFDPGRTYYARVRRGDSVEMRELVVPGETHAPHVHVATLTPGDTAPENLLRMYIQFTSRMSRESGVDHIRLLDEQGRTIEHAFLPLDGDFWNPAHTRYTLFFDPGRVKRGILPNEQLGRPIRAGHTYTIEIDSAWRDANGQPLAASYRQAIPVGPAILSAIKLDDWRLQTPRAGSRDPLVISFGRPIDYGLLERAIFVEDSNGRRIDGTLWDVGQRRWGLMPKAPWRAGDYRIVALSVLEDVAGNRIDHPFEVDMFTHVDSTSTPERYTLPFRVEGKR